MMVAMLLMNVSRAKASAERINEVMETEADIKDSVNVKEAFVKTGKVVFDEVCFAYDKNGEELVLKDINLTAEPGQTVAILGATGSGKSTLVNLIPRLYDVTKGRVLIDGIDVKEYSLNNLRSNIGMVLQEAILFTGTIRENISFGKPEATEDEIEAAAKAAQAHDFIANMPDKYDTILGQRGVNLSGGQKQRIAIARALLLKPPILILDDSTSAVDMGTEARIQSALKKLMKNCTSFIIAQRISSVLEADKIIVLEEGRIVAEGSHKELIRSSELYQDIYNSQLGEEAVING
jgi:ATP-binding cassette subfamily B protein